jgi:transcriptional regulator of acetoin/glycerol metabolism
MQQALLRVLQEKEVHPIGGTPTKIDVQVIAATNCDLPDRCEKDEFRWDLYYRLAVAELELPALRERNKEERKALIDYFLERKKGGNLSLKP